MSSPDIKKKAGGSSISGIADVKTYKDTKDPKRMRMKAIPKEKEEIAEEKSADAEDDVTFGEWIDRFS